MKFTIKTQNSEMAFDLHREDVESLVWTAFQYATGNQQYQEGMEPGLEIQPEEEVGEYAEDEECTEDGIVGAIGEEVGDPGFPEAAEGHEMPEEPGMSEGRNGLEKTAGLSGEPDGVSEQEQQGQPLPDPVQGIQEQVPCNPWAAQETGKRRYKGFLLIKCQHCGKLKGFCPKTPIDTYICNCGGKTPIQNLVNATAICECGKKWSYRTNADDQMIEVDCIQCGSPIDLAWNARRGMYVTLQDRN